MTTARECIDDFREYYTKKIKNGIWGNMKSEIYDKFREYDWSLFDEEAWKEIVSFCSIIHMIMPDDQKTKGIALHAIVYGALVCNDDLIKSFSKEFFDEELITHILEQDRLNVVSLPLEYIATTEHFQFMYNKIREICTYVWSDNGYCRTWYRIIFEQLPNAYKSKEFCDEAIEFFPGLIRSIPIEHLTQEIVNRISVCKDLWISDLNDVPSQFKTMQVCMNFYYNNYWSIRCFPKEFITMDLIKDALRNHPDVISVIPEEFLTQELCTDAFERQYKICASYKVVESMPPKFRTRDMCMKSLEQWYFPTSTTHLKYIPYKYKDEEFWTKFIKCAGYTPVDKYIPDEYKYLISRR